MAGSSGGSRNRLVFKPLAAMKLPHFCPPYAKRKPPLTEPKLPYDVKMLPVGFVTPSPDRVVTLITKLVLSPYSAAGPPDTASLHSIESTRLWFDNTLLC